MAKTETIKRRIDAYYKLLANGNSIALPTQSGHCYMVACIRASSFAIPKVVLIDQWGGFSDVVTSTANITMTFSDHATTITNNTGSYICVCILEFIES